MQLAPQSLHKHIQLWMLLGWSAVGRVDDACFGQKHRVMGQLFEKCGPMCYVIGVHRPACHAVVLQMHTQDFSDFCNDKQTFSKNVLCSHTVYVLDPE